MLKVYEIFKSIQGESTRAGMVCVFIRLSGCNLSCSYCDTAYAREDGTLYSIEALAGKVKDYQTNLALITGGEPLLQKETPQLCWKLVDMGCTVLVETNGSQNLSILPEGVTSIVDVKCPGSGHADSFNMENLRFLRKYDECKMVISDRHDFDWAMKFVKTHNLHKQCTVIFSPNSKKLKPELLAEWILESNAPVRLGLQLHKIIWGENARGV